ncbi:hypothetical protein N0V91_010959 [Didymella pomorum]|uniref:DUF6590 domain-containing protein n=1 Tax=Didymella pomorum TaxID=749634 RepID=A0A9W9D014_9PLEO|nr:hypothetical protein N0V91_010959 [Didymella pomorum]
MLYTEPAGAQSQINDEAYSFVRYQEVVYSQIRRFIVVEVKRGFVYACAISTYKNRGTNKPGCVPSEHAIAYFTGTDPAYCYFQGEFENGMNKEAIEVEPAQDAGEMKSESRIRFSKTYPVEMNLKVKDIGRVSHYSLSRLLAYWQEYH